MRISDWSSDVCASDLRYKIVGRSRFSERYVGTPATASLTEEIRKATRNFFFSLDKEGGLVYTAFSQSPYSGWTAAFGSPADSVERPLPYARQAILMGGGRARMCGRARCRERV